MFYQGPVINPAVEAEHRRRRTNPQRYRVGASRTPCCEVIDLYYKPTNTAARGKLAELFLRAEEAYFGRWDSQRFAAAGRTMPGELHLTDLFGTSPGAAHYLLEPFLDAAGRREYKTHLLDILQDLASLEGDVRGRRATGANPEGNHGHADDPRFDSVGKERELVRNSLDDFLD